MVTSDRKIFLAAIVLFLAIPSVFPRSLWLQILVAMVAAGFVAFLFVSDESIVKDEFNNKEFAPVDPTLYSLRTIHPDEIDLKDPDGIARTFRHLSFRRGGKLLEKVRRASLMGARNGNKASGTKALATLEDFFNRYHRALASEDPDLAKRTLEVLRDTRSVALNAIEDLSFTVPLALARPIRQASESVRSETLECMSTLVLKHSPSLSPSLRAALTHWSSPLPNDPSGLIGDRHSLY